MSSGALDQIRGTMFVEKISIVGLIYENHFALTLVFLAYFLASIFAFVASRKRRKRVKAVFTRAQRRCLAYKNDL